MKFEGRSQRIRERLRLTLPVRVMCQETAKHEWMELTRLTDVTPFGAAFSLTRPTEAGRLLHLTMPMPRQLRCFDHVEEQYRVWSLVRRMQKEQLPQTEKGTKGETSVPRFEVGVAFIGKQPPASFVADPATRYELGSLSAGAQGWDLREKLLSAAAAASGKGAALPRSPETRLFIPVEVMIETFDEKGEVKLSEQTVTENISRRGAAVWTTLPVERGRFVRLTSVRHQLSVVAVVRARRSGTDGVTRLHLEFVDQHWPLEGIE